MSLPTKWVEALFTKLTLAYGREFLGRWEGLDVMDVKTDWGHELAGFEAHPECIAYALANLPERAPSVMEFRAICRKCPAKPDVARLGRAVASPERVACELAKLSPLMRRAEVDSKDWARSLLTRYDGGEVLKPIQLRFAREALGLPAKSVVAA